MHESHSNSAINMLPTAGLSLLEPQSRFGDKPFRFQVVCPQNGTAVLTQSTPPTTNTCRATPPPWFGDADILGCKPPLRTTCASAGGHPRRPPRRHRRSYYRHGPERHPLLSWPAPPPTGCKGRAGALATTARIRGPTFATRGKKEPTARAPPPRGVQVPTDRHPNYTDGRFHDSGVRVQQQIIANTWRAESKIRRVERRFGGTGGGDGRIHIGLCRRSTKIYRAEKSF